MSSDQEYWDACLIKTWRSVGVIGQAVTMFENITGKRLFELKLLRVPPNYLHFKMQVRYFVAHFLPKLNDSLLKHDPSKDVNILRALQRSNYTVGKRVADEHALQHVRRSVKKAKTKIAVDAKRIASRNHDTDWNVVKGPR